MKTIVMDMDDFYLDPANGLNWLFWLKGNYPQFKVTLFTVPLRSPTDWLQEVNKIDWIEMAVHGFQHDEEETYNLSEEEMIDYLATIGKLGLFVKGFKGANWIVSNKLKRILENAGYWLAVKELDDYKGKQWPLTDPRVIHGHIWMMETHKKEGKLDFNETDEFKFISEVV